MTRAEHHGADRTTFQSEVGAIRRVLLKHARDAFVDEASIEVQWRELNYLARPDIHAASRESDAFAALLGEHGAEVIWMPATDLGLDSLYVRDVAVLCDRGAILCSMAKEARRIEIVGIRAALEASAIPILGEISGKGRLEGGDVAWIRPRTAAVGCGYRTNAEGIAQLRDLLADTIDELLVVPLPHWNGPDDVFHLMSVLSPLDDDLAVVYSPLLPVPFRKDLLDRGIELIEVPDDEFDSMGCNVLAVAPRVAVAVEGNPETRRRMEGAGVEVHTFEGEETTAKGCGGPTCLTRPLERVADR